VTGLYDDIIRGRGMRWRLDRLMRIRERRLEQHALDKDTIRSWCDARRDFEALTAAQIGREVEA
jgi:hypothetical protein